ncbi:ABC transporter family substrate-binding protein [Kineococcus sp. SYSU DK005]|uniref:ABC transporter family substrate-binding protein n=1 Tax=Kineococcus sp. SYSU DK005 TaxID=3383126 RepID=UPI003D7D3BB9
MRNTPRSARIAALALVGTLAVAGCTTSGSSGEEPAEGAAAGGTADGTITAAAEQEFQAYNNGTGDTNGTRNTFVLNQVLRGFWYYGTDGTAVPDTEFGTFEKTSDDPLTVRYSIADGAVWSDGEAVDCDDLVLTWMSRSGKFRAADGSDLFNPASTAGYEQMQQPQCADGDKEVTVVYDEPFADWQASFGSLEIMPAHVVERVSGVPDLVAAATAADPAALAPAAEFWNTGWVFNPGDLGDAANIPSNGPYSLTSWEAGNNVTLTANERYWGTPAKTRNVVVRFIDQEAQFAALQNNEVQVIEPQPNPDLVAQLESLGETVNSESYQGFTYEHFDFNFKGVFADRRVREAFAKCLPRQLIVDRLIKPQSAEAQLQDSRYTYPFRDNYETITSAAYGGQYDTTDIPGAQALLAQAGAQGTTVRVLYQAPNQRRTNEVQLLAESCGQAGFTVVDAASENAFGTEFPQGNFDVGLFAWSGSALVTGSAGQWTTEGCGSANYGCYSNPQVDDLVAQLNRATEPAAQDQLVAQIEKVLWDDLVTIPVFAFPELAAWSKGVSGVVVNPSQAQITWNMDEWALS